MITPFSYQEEPIRILTDALIRNQSALDASDTGVGKTIHALFAAKKVDQAVGVICPKSAIPAWREMAASIGVKVDFIANVEKLKALEDGPLQKHGGGKFFSWKINHNTILIFDEVHRFSASNTQNAKILAGAPPPVLMLSATAAMDPTKMRAIGHQLGLTTWREWWNWCGRNGCKRGYWGGIEFKGGKTNIDRLHRQIFHTGRGVRVRIKDLGDLFPHIRLETVLVPVEDQKAIDEAYAEELAALEANADPLEATIRARQIAEHEKLPAVIEMADDLLEEGNSVVIFVNFRDTLRRLEEAFADDAGCAVIHGDQTGDERADAVDRFQTNKIRVMIAMAQAGGVSLSLGDLDGLHPRVSLVCPGWSAIDLRQCLGRTPRANSKSPCLQKIIFADETIEMRIRRKVEGKLTKIDLLNDGDLNAQ